MCHGARVDEQRNSSSRVQRHFTGLPGLLREQRAHRLGRGVDLAAEPAADGAADDLEPVERQLQVRGDDAHREVERLGAGVDREAAVRLGHDERDLRLERHVLDRGGPVDALDDRVRLLEGLVDRALADLAAVHLALEVRIPVPPLVDLRRVVVEGAPDVEERLALLELDPDRVDGRLGRVLVLGRDERDRLALVPHLVVGEERLVGRDPERGEVAVLEERHVVCRDHRADAGHRLGLRRVEAGERRAVVRRAERLRPERAGDPHVVDVLRTPGDVLDPVVAGDPCADRLHWTPPRFVIPGLVAVTVRSNSSPRATAATASMIFT